jgi:hypothetical protein
MPPKLTSTGMTTLINRMLGYLGVAESLAVFISFRRLARHPVKRAASTSRSLPNFDVVFEGVASAYTRREI